MLLQIDLDSEEPIYRQIRLQVVHAVATGELLPGDSLPSVRSLAGDLGVNMHTVNKAYAVLRDEGYITMRRRSGAVVADLAARFSSARIQEKNLRIAQGLRGLAVEYLAQGGSPEEFARLAQEQAQAAASPGEDDVR